MISLEEAAILLILLEGFLYGKISVLCVFPFSLKKSNYSLVLGLYSGIFAIYLLGPSKESRTASIVFYVLCLLYVLSTVTVVCDLLRLVIQVSNYFISLRISFF